MLVNEEQLRVWAMHTENEIFRDANAQLMRYAKALEEELLLHRARAGPLGEALAGCEALESLTCANCCFC
jgi:hypothetical protein